MITEQDHELFGARLRLPAPQRLCLGIEFGIQNGLLAVTIASSTLMLNNPAMTIAPVIYSLVMLILGFAFGFVVNRLRKRNAVVAPTT